MTTTEKPYAPACERNREPILAVLRKHLAGCRQVLEVGSGTGQHAVHFAAAMPWLTWQCSDVAGNLPAIRMWLDEAGLANTPAPVELDVACGPWPAQHFDAVFSANAVHIMGWPEVQALFAGVDAALAGRDWSSSPEIAITKVPAKASGEISIRAEISTTASGTLVLYGPFNYGGDYSSDSNHAFDAWLKARDPRSGIRDFEAIDALARGIDLQLVDDIAMPANNRCLIWRRESAIMA